MISLSKEANFTIIFWIDFNPLNSSGERLLSIKNSVSVSIKLELICRDREPLRVPLVYSGMKSVMQNDESIIESVLAGDSDAYATLVLRYQRMILNYFWRMTQQHDDVEDLAQELFLRAYSHLGKFDPARNVPFGAWLIRIARNLCLNHLRRKNHRHHLDQSFMPLEESDEGSDSALHRQRMSDYLQQVLSRSSPALRETFILKEVNGFPVNSIAQIQGISAGTVKSRLSRMRNKLALERDEYDG